MKLRFVWLFPVIIFCNLYGQVVTTDPQFPTVDEEIVVYFDLAKASRTDLVGYSGDLYVHTGVLTSESSSNKDWMGVIAQWSENTSKAKLTLVSPDLYKITINKVVDFYKSGTFDPAVHNVTHLAFVVRNANGSKQTEDLFAQIYKAELNVKFTSPVGETFVKTGEAFNIKAAGSGADSLALFLNGNRISSTTSNSFEKSHTFSSVGLNQLIIKAYSNGDEVSDTASIYVRGNVSIVELPANTKYGVNYNSASNVTFAIYAPGKEFIYLLGDFNQWQISENFKLYKTPDGNVFWINFDVGPGIEYAYQYYIDGDIKVADPYSEKILDPWNDEYIPSNVYPNLKSYPDGAEGIVSVFQTNQTEYAWEIENFVKPKKEKLVIYEMLVRDFIQEHSYKSVIDSLDYIERLGVNAIELMPINEFEGNSSWGYNPSFLFAPDKYYGSKNDLKRFIDECHKRGIAVIMDIVLNHSYGQSPFVQMYFDGSKPSADNPWFNVDHNFETGAAHWGYDFNHESLKTQELVDRVTSYWLTEYKFDGFRFDFTKGFGNNPKLTSVDEWGSLYDADRIRLLKRMTDQIWNTDPNAYVIFEHLAENSEEKELADYGILLWGNMNHNYNEAAMGYNESNKSNLNNAVYKYRNWNSPNLVTYMESHDEERLMYKNLLYGNSKGDYNIKVDVTALARQMLVSAFFYTIPGPKMLWQFGEVGYDFSINDGGRLSEKPIRWDYYHEKYRRYLYDVTSELINLKTKHEVFSTDNFDYALTGEVKRINLTSDTLSVTVIGNFDVETNSVIPAFQNTGWWYDYFSKDSIQVNDVNATIQLEAGEFRLYTSKKITDSNEKIYTDVEELTNEIIDTYDLNQNYPNPFNPSTSFSYQIPEETKVSVRIYNSLGQLVKTLVDEYQQKGVYKVVWKGESDSGSKVGSGVYFYQMQTNEFSETKKMILVK